MTAASVVLPTYNEAETICPIVSQLLESSLVAEIIVVDDDSPDGTAATVRDSFASDRVTVIRRTGDSGLSSAVLRGFDAATTEVVACMDADGQHPVGSTLGLIRLVDDGADVAVGSRHTESGMVADDWPLRRRVLSHGATALAWAAVPPARQLTDPMSGLFAIRRDLVEASRDQLRPTGYKILLELLARCPVETVGELGYTFRSRAVGGSNLGLAEHIKYVRHLGRLTVPSRRSVDRPAQTPAEVDQ